MSRNVIAPYPFERWPLVTRAAATAGRRALRAMPPRTTSHASQAATDLLGAACAASLEPRSVAPSNPLFGIALEHDSGSRAVGAVDPRLAALALDRLLGSESKALPAVAPPLGSIEQGIALYLAARMLPTETGWHIRSTLDTAADTARWLGTADLCFAGHASVGEARSWIRLWARLTAAPRPTESWLPPDFGVPMTLEAGWGVAKPNDLATLRTSDVLIPEDGWLEGVAPLRGGSRLRALGARRTTWRVEFDGERVRIAEEQRDLNVSATRGRNAPANHDRPRGIHRMNDDGTEVETPPEGSDRVNAAIRKVGDAEIEISIELARFTMRLDDISALRVGEVLASGRALGESATLRTAGRAIARGELVTVDGEIGLRIQELLSD